VNGFGGEVPLLPALLFALAAAAGIAFWFYVFRLIFLEVRDVIREWRSPQPEKRGFEVTLKPGELTERDVR
jgi:hypothetical protein